MNCSPHFLDRLAAIDTFAAYRPAGTREALPGTKALFPRWNA